MGSSEAGSYNDERPVRTVVIPRDFAVSTTEITFKQWNECVADKACNPKLQRAEVRADGPVTNVSMEDVADYLNWLRNETLKDGYRLLTEAEWEYAARAGSKSAYPWGLVASRAHANYGSDQCCGGAVAGADKWFTEAAPVGSFPANEFGLYDMHGNVWEWVDDCYASYNTNNSSSRAIRDGGDCSIRILRGGAWNSPARDIRSAVRGRAIPNDAGKTIGFRIAFDWADAEGK